MKIIIDEEGGYKNGLSIDELMLLLIVDNNIDITLAKKSLIKKGLITSVGEINSSGYRITNEGIELLNNSIIDSFEYEKKDENRLNNLAEKLRELYPSGRKEGTNYMWRGTNAEIVRKLKTLENKYKFKFTDEQAIKATQEYIQSFNGNYKFMQLLKYFILKTVSDADGNIEVKSEFMSLIENEGQEDRLREDWEATLV